MLAVLVALGTVGWALWTALRRRHRRHPPLPPAGRAGRGHRAGAMGARPRRGRRDDPGAASGGPTPVSTGARRCSRKRVLETFPAEDPAWEARFTEAMSAARFRCTYLNAEEAPVGPERLCARGRQDGGDERGRRHRRTCRPGTRRAGARRAGRLRGHPAPDAARAVQRLPRRGRRSRRRNPGALAVRGDLEAGPGPADGGHRALGRTRWWSPTPTPRWSPVDRLPADAGATTVRVRTTWNGAGGIGGFFERTFAPKGLRRVYARAARAAGRASSRPAERAATGVRRDDGPVTAATHRDDRRTPAARRPRRPAGRRRRRRPLRRRAVHRLRHPRLPGRDRQPAPAHADDLPDLHPRPASAGTATGRAATSAGGRSAAPGRTPGTARSRTCRRPGCSAA